MKPPSGGLLDHLVDALRVLPGVGQKSAQRAAYHLMQRDREGAFRLAEALSAAASGLGHCERCHTLSDRSICALCSDPQRDDRQLCVVENPADQAVFERTGMYRGRYFVLMNRLSPLEGVGPDDIGARALLRRVADGEVAEVILATGFSAEGEATAHALQEALRTLGVRVTRLARGVPVGSDIEYVDLGTLAHALADRR